MYEQYEPFYDQLLSKCPEMRREGELFQFSLPTLNITWSELNSETVYAFLDTLPAEQGMLYIPGAARFTGVYEDYLDSLDGVDSPDVEKAAAEAQRSMKEDQMSVLRAGKEMMLPDMKVSKTNTLFEEKILSFAFSSDMWADSQEPVTLSGGMDLSEWIGVSRYTFDITIEGLRCCAIERGRWYREELLNQEKRLIGGGMLKEDTFWGDHGAFSLLPQKVLFVDKMRIKLNIQMISPTKTRAAFGPILSAPPGNESFYFLGIPVELDMPSIGFRARMANAADILRNCFRQGSDHTSILGVTSKRL